MPREPRREARGELGEYGGQRSLFGMVRSLLLGARQRVPQEYASAARVVVGAVVAVRKLPLHAPRTVSHNVFHEVLPAPPSPAPRVSRRAVVDPVVRIHAVAAQALSAAHLASVSAAIAAITSTASTFLAAFAVVAHAAFTTCAAFAGTSSGRAFVPRSRGSR
jgi:hypothetical protein